MTREDLCSGILLTLICLAFWWSGWIGGPPALSAAPRTRGPERAGALAWEFGRGRSAFRLTAPPDWRWTPGSSGPPEDGWRSIGRFEAPRASVAVAWRGLDREIRVEDRLDHECRVLGLSVLGPSRPEGRRVRTASAETWKEIAGERCDGLLILVKQGDRLFRLVATLAPGMPPADRASAREALLSLQPVEAGASSCAEPLAAWRVTASSPFTLRYPASWGVAGSGSSGSGALLHLRSRLGGRWRGSLLAWVVPASDAPGSGAGIDAAVAELARREPECRPVPSGGREPAPEVGTSPATWTRAGRVPEPWECRTAWGRGVRAAWGLALLTPTRDCDPEAWMVNVAALDLVARLAREEGE